MALLDAIDIDLTFDGDFVLGPDGDLGDTSDNSLRSLLNQLRDLVKSEQNDWETDPNFAGDLTDFIGESNTRIMGKRIEDRIKSRVQAIGLVPSQDLIVKAVPIHVNQIAVMIQVNCTPTPENKLVLGEPVTVTFIYDTIERGIYFTLPNTNDNNPFRRF